MKRTRRAAAVVLGLVMVLALLLTACSSGKPSADAPKPDTNAGDKAKADADAKAKADADAKAKADADARAKADADAKAKTEAEAKAKTEADAKKAADEAKKAAEAAQKAAAEAKAKAEQTQSDADKAAAEAAARVAAEAEAKAKVQADAAVTAKAEAEAAAAAKARADAEAAAAKGVAMALDAKLPDSVLKAGKIVFASDTTYPPMEFVGGADGKTIMGFDVDLVNELCRRLGVKAEVKTNDWDGLIPGLQSHRFDAIISTMNVTPERSARVDFVEYARMSSVFVVRKNSAPVKSLEDLKGKVVAVQVSTAQEELVRKQPGVKNVLTYDDFSMTFPALRDGRADVIVIDEPVGGYYAAQHPNDFVVSGLATNPDPVGIAVNKDADGQLIRQALSAALLSVKTDGTFKALAEKWLAEDVTIRY